MFSRQRASRDPPWLSPNTLSALVCLSCQPLSPTTPHSFSLSLMSTLISYISICPPKIVPIYSHNSLHISTFTSQDISLPWSRWIPEEALPLSLPASFGRLLHSSSLSHVPAGFLRKLRLCGMLSGTVCMLHYSSLLVSSVSKTAHSAQLILRG